MTILAECVVVVKGCVADIENAMRVVNTDDRVMGNGCKLNTGLYGRRASLDILETGFDCERGCCS